MIYFIQAGESGPIKIGTAQDVWRRLAELQTGHYERLNFIGLLEGEREKEIQIHKTLANFRLYKEWFNPSLEVLEFAKQNTLPLPEQNCTPISKKTPEYKLDQYEFTITELAKMLKLNERTIRRWIKAGKLPAVGIPGRGRGATEFRISASAVENLGFRVMENDEE